MPKGPEGQKRPGVRVRRRRQVLQRRQGQVHQVPGRRDRDRAGHGFRSARKGPSELQEGQTLRQFLHLDEGCLPQAQLTDADAYLVHRI